MVFQYNFILGQGVGFISVEDVYCVEILNGVEVFYDDFLF